MTTELVGWRHDIRDRVVSYAVPQTAHWRPADDSTLFMLETSFEIKTGAATLASTFCAPSIGSRFPCVLMLPGSGPLDRDGNMPGQRLDIFNTIAHSLAAAGFASLRYDKRGCGSSTGEYFAAGYFDFVADAVACFDALRRDTRVASDRLYALGHSEGTVTGMHLSFERSAVAGIIQLCPTVENFESALMRQARHMQHGLVRRSESEDLVASQERLIKRVRANEAQPHEVEVHGLGLQWFREVLDLDVPQLYARMHAAMLLIAGEKDVQCSPAELLRIPHSTCAAVEIHLVPNLTHVLRCDLQEASIFRYDELLQRPVEACVLSLISQWLVRRAAV